MSLFLCNGAEMITNYTTGFDLTGVNWAGVLVIDINTHQDDTYRYVHIYYPLYALMRYITIDRKFGIQANYNW